MFTALLLVSFAMMLYGVARMIYADIHGVSSARGHALWVPGGALFFAAGILLMTWL